jgi:cytochrome bd ubiquinol oxidase subunit I
VKTEAGRQPWSMSGLLRTAESASPIEAPAVSTSLAASTSSTSASGAGLFYVLRLRRPPKTPADLAAIGMPPHDRHDARAGGVAPGQ